MVGLQDMMLVKYGVTVLLLSSIARIIHAECPNNATVPCNLCKERCNETVSGSTEFESCGYCSNDDPSIRGLSKLCRCAAGDGERCCSVECPRGTFGKDCQGVCYCSNVDSCSGRDGKCDGDCLSGYTGNHCDIMCTNATYGPNCRSTCGKCRHGYPCDIYTGSCEDGCGPGYHGDKCDEEYTTNILVVLGGVSVAILVVIVICTIAVRVLICRKRVFTFDAFPALDRTSSKQTSETKDREDGDKSSSEPTDPMKEDGNNGEPGDGAIKSVLSGAKVDVNSKSGTTEEENRENPNETKETNVNPGYKSLNRRDHAEHKYLVSYGSIENEYVESVLPTRDHRYINRTDDDGYLRPVPSDTKEYFEPSDPNGYDNNEYDEYTPVEEQVYDYIDGVSGGN